MIMATVSGSFHRHMHAITAAVYELASRGVRVLSPADPRIVAAQGEFLFVASDRVRSVRLVQDRHLESIRAASFLWLVCPDGYVGRSSSMELGYAAASGVPVFSTHLPGDLTLREYVTAVPSLTEALRITAAKHRETRRQGLLIDPHASIEEAHEVLRQIEGAMTSSAANDPAHGLHRNILTIHSILGLPTTVQ